MSSISKVTFIPANNKDVKTWAKQIRNLLRASIKNIVYAGQQLEDTVEDFKQQDGHWKHMYSELLDELGLSRRTAGYYRQIAAHPVLSDSTNYKALPGNWTVLGELAALPAPEVKRKIKSGEITPKLSQAKVRSWKQSNRKSPSGSPKKKPDPIDQAHDVLVKLPKADFGNELLNLIYDHPQFSIQDMRGVLDEQNAKQNP